MQVKSCEPATAANSDRRTDAALAGLVLLLALLYRLYALTGDITFDSVVYAQNAFNLLNGTFRLDTYSWYDHRLTVFFPVAIAYGVLGVGTFSTHLWPLILSLSQIGAVLWFGYRWLNRRVAVLAALLLALLPLDVKYAGVLSPDMVIGCFLTLSVVLWIVAFEGRVSPNRASLFLAGLFCGLAILTRPYAAVMLLFFVGHAVWRRSLLRSFFWWCLGLISIGTPIVVLYAVLTGDPLFRLHAISSFYGAPPAPESAGWLAYPALVWNVGNATGLFAPLFAVTALLALIRPTRQRLILLVWIAPMLLYLQFGSMSLDSYVPVFKRVRFLTPLLAPAALLAALVIVEELPELVRKAATMLKSSAIERVSRFLLVFLMLALASSSLVFIQGHRGRHLKIANSFRSAVAVLRTADIPVLVDHWRTGIRLSYYFDFEEGSHFYEGADESKRMEREVAPKASRLGYLKWYEDPVDVPEAFVVLEDDILRQAAEIASVDPTRSTYPAKDIPAYSHDPPAAWQSLGRFGSILVLRTSGQDSQ
jgi:hypothetical protein